MLFFSLTRRVEQAIISSTECNKAITLYEVHRTLSLCCIQWTIFTIWNKAFGGIYEKPKKTEFSGNFSVFEAEAQLGALKILKSRRTKVVPN
jgi:hypothetical protein